MPGIPLANSTEGDRVTLMLGFWNEVQLTQDSSTGPNVPFEKAKNEWAREFNAVPYEGFSFAEPSEASADSIETIDPLWTETEHSIDDGSAFDEDFGEYRRFGGTRFSGRFFLETKQTTQIDREILHRTYSE